MAAPAWSFLRLRRMAAQSSRGGRKDRRHFGRSGHESSSPPLSTGNPDTSTCLCGRRRRRPRRWPTRPGRPPRRPNVDWSGARRARLRPAASAADSRAPGRPRSRPPAPRPACERRLDPRFEEVRAFPAATAANVQGPGRRPGRLGQASQPGRLAEREVDPLAPAQAAPAVGARPTASRRPQAAGHSTVAASAAVSRPPAARRIPWPRPPRRGRSAAREARPRGAFLHARQIPVMRRRPPRIGWPVSADGQAVAGQGEELLVGPARVQPGQRGGRVASPREGRGLDGASRRQTPADPQGSRRGSSPAQRRRPGD